MLRTYVLKNVNFNCIYLFSLLIWMQIHPGSQVFASAVASRLMEVVDEY